MICTSPFCPHCMRNEPFNVLLNLPNQSLAQFPLVLSWILAIFMQTCSNLGTSISIVNPEPAIFTRILVSSLHGSSSLKTAPLEPQSSPLETCEEQRLLFLQKSNKTSFALYLTLKLPAAIHVLSICKVM